MTAQRETKTKQSIFKFEAQVSDLSIDFINDYQLSEAAT